MDQTTKRAIIATGIAIVLVVIIGIAAKSADSKPGKYDELAQCISDSGATFYGAWWCPNCERQLSDFGKSQTLLPYIECANPDRSQTAICTEASVTAYPTWVFPDGRRLEGTQKIEDLATITECVLPGESEVQPIDDDLNPAFESAQQNLELEIQSRGGETINEVTPTTTFGETSFTTTSEEETSSTTTVKTEMSPLATPEIEIVQ